MGAFSFVLLIEPGNFAGLIGDAYNSSYILIRECTV